MDRFIPNRSASNLDVANYNVSREAKDVENLDALSPTKVGAAAGGGPGPGPQPSSTTSRRSAPESQAACTLGAS